MKNDFLLLLTAAVWGLAFVAQRVGMESLGPFTYNAVRFALGAGSLLPVLALTRGKAGSPRSGASLKSHILWGGIAGCVLFGGASLQQVGIVYTTAGKAGFITGLYVVLVPLLGAALGTRSGLSRWIGALSAAAGLYLLSITSGFSLGRGDFLVFLCAFFYAGHVLLMGAVAKRFDAVLFSLIQYLLCSALSFGAALAAEDIRTDGLIAAWLPLVYGGVFSVGVAYSLQIYAQKSAHPTHAAIILSLEGLFAAAGGFFLLGERFAGREILGCLFMLAGMIVSQFGGTEKKEKKPCL